MYIRLSKTFVSTSLVYNAYQNAIYVKELAISLYFKFYHTKIVHFKQYPIYNKSRLCTNNLQMASFTVLTPA